MPPLSNGQFGQLSMFTTAREIHDKYTHIDLSDYEPDLDELYGIKAEQADEEGYGESIREHGVREPVEIFHGRVDSLSYQANRQQERRSGAPLLWDGHHRVAVQYEHDPDRLLPIVHDDEDAMQYRFRSGRS